MPILPQRNATTLGLLATIALFLCLSGFDGAPKSLAAAQPLLAVDADFPGGSVRVLEIDQARRLVRIVPSEHPGRGWECWWYFRLSGITPGETLTIDVGPAPWATPERAMVSLDRQTWQHTAPGKRDGKRIAYALTIDASEVWMAWGPPFVPSDAQRLVSDAAAASSHAKAFELCRTREDRPVPALRVAQPVGPGEIGSDEKRFGIWIQARQHAWESGSSWVCQGFTEWLISDEPRAESLRKRSHVTIVPIMDIDNVAIGAGGKQQHPQDHNRDWSDMPHWHSVAAAQKEILKMNEAGQFDMFVDLHNPGPSDKHPYYYVPPRDMLTPRGRRNLAEFVAATQIEMTGPLKYLGETRESDASYDAAWKQISKNWVTERTREHVVSLTLETAWNTPHSTAENYRRVGRELGLAIERYLRPETRRAERQEVKGQ